MIVSDEFPLKLADCTELTPFLIFKSMNRGIYGPGITWSLKSINADPQMEVYIVNNGGEECMLGLLSLNKEYPFTCIFRETLKEKINDWFVKQDVDFEEFKKFSDQFHMVSGDPSEIRSFLWNKPLDELTAFPEMEAEINRRSAHAGGAASGRTRQRVNPGLHSVSDPTSANRCARPAAR